MSGELNEDLKEELKESYRKRELTPLERVIINAAIIAGITFFSTLSIDFPPTAQNVWAALIAAMLALMTQLRTLTEITSDLKPKKPLVMLI